MTTLSVPSCNEATGNRCVCGGGGGGGDAVVVAPFVTFRLVVALLQALDSHPFFPSHVASGCCFLSAVAAGAPAGVVSAFADPSGWCAGAAGVVSAFAEPSGWCAGAVLDVVWCAVCASVALSSWRIEVVLVVEGVV